MLSYQHGYHAGNKADLHKHGLLVWLLDRLTQKDKPATYIDIFAGRGLYDLQSDASQKTGEARQGVLNLTNKDWPSALKPWQDALVRLNQGKQIRRYGGSPWIATQLLRRQDTLHFCELHPKEFSVLESNFKQDSRCNLYFKDAYESLNALVPPMPRRGLVLIDPSYEIKGEYQQIADQLPLAVTKWQVGCFMLWYPLLEADRHLLMLRQLESQLAMFDILQAEWRWREPWHEDTNGMLGSGLLLINPPWQADIFMKQWQAQLCQIFSGGRSSLKSRAPNNEK